MARYKHVDLSPRFFAVELEKQLLPGSFAHAVHHLLDHDFDLSGFDVRYRNDTFASEGNKSPSSSCCRCTTNPGVVRVVSARLTNAWSDAISVGHCIYRESELLRAFARYALCEEAAGDVDISWENVSISLPVRTARLRKRNCSPARCLSAFRK